jgi:hypothetical protein
MHESVTTIGDPSLACMHGAVCRHARTVHAMGGSSVPACHFGSAVGAARGRYDTAGSRTRVCFQKRRGVARLVHYPYICHELNMYCWYHCLHLAGCSYRSLAFHGRLCYVLITSLVSTDRKEQRCRTLHVNEMRALTRRTRPRCQQ